MSEDFSSGPIETLPANDGGKQLATVVYILYFVGYFVVLTNLIGVIIAHIKASEAQPIYQSHFRYQMRTFWVGLLFAVIGVLLFVVKIGILVLAAVAIWTLVRNIKGLVRVLDRRPIDNPSTWLW